MKSCLVRFQITPKNNIPATTWIAPMAIRVVLLYDRQPNGSLPSGIQDVFQDRSVNGTLSYDHQSALNMENRDRFYVLRDWKIMTPLVLNGTGGANYGVTQIWNNNAGPCDFFESYVKLKNLETHYKANTGNIGDIATGSLLLCTYCNTATSYWTVDVSTRLKFIDV